jgi:hypothetical protein
MDHHSRYLVNEEDLDVLQPKEHLNCARLDFTAGHWTLRPSHVTQLPFCPINPRSTSFKLLYENSLATPDLSSSNNLSQRYPVSTVVDLVVQ